MFIARTGHNDQSSVRSDMFSIYDMSLLTELAA
jgi:hypothetical protein